MKGHVGCLIQCEIYLWDLPFSGFKLIRKKSVNFTLFGLVQTFALSLPDIILSCCKKGYKETIFHCILYIVIEFVRITVVSQSPNRLEN